MWFYRLPGSLMRDSFFSIVGVQVGSACCLLCPFRAQGRDRPTETGLEMCRLLGSERLAEVPSDPEGVPLAWPLPLVWLPQLFPSPPGSKLSWERAGHPSSLGVPLPVLACAGLS